MTAPDLVPLAVPYDPARDYTGWLMSEKLDGVRALWTGSELVTRNGNRINAPDYYTDQLPKGFRLDGELWMGRGLFECTSGAVRASPGDSRWLGIIFMVFDAPDAAGGLLERLRVVTGKEIGWPVSTQVYQTLIRDRAHLQAEFARVIKLGGEGLILRDPNAPWTPGRSWSWVKMKPQDETDAVVVAPVAGKSAVHVDEKGLRFRVKVGYPIPPGTVIRVTHNGRTRNGVPRFPVFAGVRAEQEVAGC